MGYILTDTSPAYELVGDITVSSATTSVSFTGLNFTSADDLLLVSDFKNDNPSYSSEYTLFVNNNTTETNYYTQDLYAGGATISPSRINASRMGFASDSYGSRRTLMVTKIKITNSGYFVAQANSCRNYTNNSAGIEIQDSYLTSTFTTSSIASITIGSRNTIGSSPIGIGSRFRLYKLVAEKVADITVSTATTSVDITGLSIDKGSEYMLVSDVVNGAGTVINGQICVNGNNTNTNYYVQRLGAYSSSTIAGRYNDNQYMGIATSDKSFSICNIKLTNNGNFVYQSNEIYKYGSSLIELNNFNGTSTFTTSSITQITVKTTSTNGIGVGSRFQLYKLR